MTTPSPGQPQLAAGPAPKLSTKDQAMGWFYLALAAFYVLKLTWMAMHGAPNLTFPTLVILSSLAQWADLHSRFLPSGRRTR